jgi:predicted nucleic acid-binding protein
VRILLDTCVLSELRRPAPDPGVQRAVEEAAGEDLFLSVISIGEIAKGIALLRESQKKRALGAWLQALERDYADRLLAIDREISHLWGELTAAAQKTGKVIPAADGLIAATARRHGLHLMTRNTGHFEAAGVALVNPWD